MKSGMIEEQSSKKKFKMNLVMNMIRLKKNTKNMMVLIVIICLKRIMVENLTGHPIVKLTLITIGCTKKLMQQLNKGTIKSLKTIIQNSFRKSN